MKVKQRRRDEHGSLVWVYTTFRESNSAKDQVSRLKAYKRLDPRLPVYCCCTPECVAMALVTKKNGGVHLRNPAKKGHTHKTICMKYKNDRDFSANELSQDLKQQAAPQGDALHMHNSVFTVANHEVAGNATVSIPRRKKRRKRKWLTPGASTPLGLYARAMHMSAANVNDPRVEARSFQRFTEGINDALAKLEVNDRPATERVYVAGTGNLFAMGEWIDTYGENEGEDALALVFGVISGVHILESHVELSISGVAPVVKLTKSAWSTARSNGWFSDINSALRRSEKGELKVHCAITVRRTEQGLLAERADLLVTTNKWIQVHSDIERDEVDRLCAMNRFFIKPIYAWNGDKYVHDIILLDTKHPHRIELNGWTSPEYLDYKKTVRAHLKANYPEGSWSEYSPGDPELVYPEPMPECDWHTP